MSEMSKNANYTMEALMRYMRRLGFGEIYTKIDVKTGLYAMIAIHSTQLGPAIGGCRFYPYPSMGHALKDALRLSYMMTFKAAFAGLPHGGGKSVIIQPSVIEDREALFRSFGDFVQEVNGRYIAALDMGTTLSDMDRIAERSAYVIKNVVDGEATQIDPAPYTARGVLRGQEAAVYFKLGLKSLAGLHVAIQGCGRVAYYLSKFLYERGAKLTVCDTELHKLDAFVHEFDATVVSPEAIYEVECDIFAPCAMGGVINLEVLHRLKTKIIAGAANNQLAHHHYAMLAAERGILYIPDYVINAGGLMQVASLYAHQDLVLADRLIENLYDRMLHVLERSVQIKRLPLEVADLMVLERLNTAS